MKRNLWMFLLTLLPWTLPGQVSLNVQLPPAGLIQRDQLWNLAVINNGQDAIDVMLLLDLKDAQSGQSVVTANTGATLLPKGVKLISAQDIQPIYYNYLTAGFAGNYLPLGSYIACYRVAKNTGETPQVLAEECVRINIQPLSPPLLNLPADRDTLTHAYPQFSWMPPSPVDMFNDLQYELLLTEVLQGQSPGEAILYNTPVYTSNYLTRLYEPYPPSMTALDTGKLYAWQIVARNGGNFAAQSEVWTFTVKSGLTVSTPVAPGVSYLVIKQEGDDGGVHIVTDRQLNVKYYSSLAPYDGTIFIRDAKGQVVMQMPRKIVYGNNYIRLQLDRSLQKQKIYQVEIVDSRKKVRSATFIIQ